MVRIAGWSLLLLLAGTTGLVAQEYGARLGTVKRGGKVSFEPTGPGVLFDALDPVVRKWYVPQELYAQYQWKQWQYSNYARDLYQRYVRTSIEGDYFYDAYGDFLTKGWLIYDWREENPQPFGSSLYKDSRFGGWFSNLVIASDHKGQYHYAITIGNEIRTTLTPMTFSKPLFNGIQWDFASDKYSATLLLSRANAPNPENVDYRVGGDQRTDVTNLLGSRAVAQIGEFARVGATFITAYQANTQVGYSGSDMFRGQLSGAQDFSNVSVIEVRLTDDSPADGADGAALFAADVLIYDLEGKETRGSEIGFRPQVEGGFQRQGFLSADGNEKILLRFDFTSRTYTGPDPDEIQRVTVELVLANDYLVEVTSDRQDGVYLPVAEAAGNVRDSSNQRVVAFDYGLPTANQILGATLEVTDLAGFDGYAEVDLNRQYRQYPNRSLEQHYTADRQAQVWLLNLSRRSYPYFALAEAFSVPPHYSTAMPLLDPDGKTNYTNTFWRCEFVDDNDDQDQFPDWFRKGSGELDREVFPGMDENNDFVYDFNQNDNEDSPNLIPDYEEPFLRFDADRPEFLYGVDMNHNQWADRFENDEEPDYPYRRDQRGYNVYAGAFLLPEARVTLGRQRVRQISDQRRNYSNYGLLTVDKDWSGWGRVRVFEDLRRVRDDIREDLLQWIQEPNTRGTQRLVRDVLPAQNTWINTTWLGWDWSRPAGLSLGTKLKREIYHQLGKDDEVELRRVRRDGSFLGLIGKAEYPIRLGSLTVTPRWKGEYRHQVPVGLDQPLRHELSQILMLLLRQPFMRRSVLESGLEYQWFRQLRHPVPAGADDRFRGLVLATQLTNLSDYQGYRVTTVLGFEVARRAADDQQARVRTHGFATVYAGVEQ
jgi:hypothetical protein